MRRRRKRNALIRKIRRVVKSMRKRRHYAKVVRGGSMMS